MVKCKIKISSWHFVITNYDVFNTVTKEREGCYKAGSFKIFPNTAYCKEHNKRWHLSFLDKPKANSEKLFSFERKRLQAFTFTRKKTCQNFSKHGR